MYSDHSVEVSHFRVGEASSGPAGADSRKHMAQGARLLQFGLYNLGSTFSLFWIWVSPVPQFFLCFAFSTTLSLCLYPSAPGTAPLALSNHVVTESGALGRIF